MEHVITIGIIVVLEALRTAGLSEFIEVAQICSPPAYTRQEASLVKCVRQDSLAANASQKKYLQRNMVLWTGLCLCVSVRLSISLSLSLSPWPPFQSQPSPGEVGIHFPSAGQVASDFSWSSFAGNFGNICKSFSISVFAYCCHLSLACTLIPQRFQPQQRVIFYDPPQCPCS